MKNKPGPIERLKHIIEAIDRIKRFTKKMDEKSFSSHEMAQYAVIKNFEIIGKACYHLSPDFKNNYPHVEWQKITSFRQILVHDYYKINMGIVWNTIQNRLDELNSQINIILSELD